MKIKDILYSLKPVYCFADESLEFKNIVYKKADISRDSIYFHLKDSVAFSEIFTKDSPRPVVSITDFDPRGELANIPYIKVKNVRAALAEVYSLFCDIDYSKLKFIGVTGTNGKTTTAELIKQILKEDGKKTGFIGTGKIESDSKKLTAFDYSMTTPDPDLLYPSIKRMQNDGCEYIIMEVSSHALALDKLSPIYFDMAVFTNLSHEHLDFHHTMEEYYQAKMKLFKKCKTGIFNIDDHYGRRAYTEARCQKSSFGVLWQADVIAKEPKLNGFAGSSYLYKEKDFIFKMNLPLVGAHNIYNSLSAISACVKLGIRPCVAKKALEKASSPEGRFETIHDKITVIIDYAHTPLALENTLKTIKSAKNPEQKLICVFGCGGLRDKGKRPIMGRIAEDLADFTIITEDNSRSENRDEIIKDILLGIDDKSRIAAIPRRKDAIESAVINAEDGSIIAILGKGAERYNQNENGTEPFDEREIIRKSLEKRKSLT